MSTRSPSTVPLKSSGKPGSLLTVADMMSEKLPGSVWMLGQSMPNLVRRIGNQDGHLKEPGLASSKLSTTPKPGNVTNCPLPVKANFRILPPIFSGPALTSAPSESNFATYSSAPASLSISIPSPVTVRNEPSFISSLSDLNLKPDGTPSVNERPARTASVSASGPSVIFIEKGLPGSNSAPPEAMKTSPLKSTPLPNVRPKSVTPARMSFSFRKLPILMSSL